MSWQGSNGNTSSVSVAEPRLSQAPHPRHPVTRIEEVKNSHNFLTVDKVAMRMMGGWVKGVEALSGLTRPGGLAVGKEDSLAGGGGWLGVAEVVERDADRGPKKVACEVLRRPREPGQPLERRVRRP